MRFPSLAQWKQIFKVLKKRDRITLFVFLILTIGSSGFLATNFYLSNTKIVPDTGGTYIEGVVGQPRFINPIYGETNDTDRALIDLIFSGLMTYDTKGHLAKNLAESYKISEDGRTYDFQLKDNIFWHDAKPLTADDIIFTIKTIQNSDYKSPLRAHWIDIDVQKVSDRSVRFNLRSPYNSFLENATVKIIPKHIWENISPENFALSSYNLQPVGSGPFIFSGIKQAETGFIKNLELQSNHRYYDKPSFVSAISFQFFEKKEDLVEAANEGDIDGFALNSLDYKENEIRKEIKQGRGKKENFSVYSFKSPRYFAVFFNSSSSSIFSEANLRKALSHATNKEELIKKIIDETKVNVTTIDSPILPDFFNYQAPSNINSFNIDQAKSLLDKAGFKDSGNGLRQKALNKKPAFQFVNYLKAGSQGNEVIQLQSCLARLSEDFKKTLQNETNGKYGKATEEAVTEFQKKYLPDKEPTGETGSATRNKLNELCFLPPQDSQSFRFTLTTVNQPQLLETANKLKDYWQNVGASVDIKAVSLTDIKPIIKERSYDALLYGEALGSEPDLYPFWHSSQKIDPGLNISSYENKDVDKLLKEARETLDTSVKQQKYEQLQDIILNDAPALFLYNPDYLYWASKKVQGIDTQKITDPAKRFINVTNWFIETKRVWK